MRRLAERIHDGSVPTPDEIASLLQVEHLLDQRWPETKLEPSTARISALRTARPAAARLSVDPHRGHQRQDVGGPHGRRAADGAALAAPAAPPARTCSRRWSASRSTASRSRPAQYVAIEEIEPFVELVDKQSEAAGGPARDEQVRGRHRDGVRGVRRRADRRRRRGRDGRALGRHQRRRRTGRRHHPDRRRPRRLPRRHHRRHRRRRRPASSPSRRRRRRPTPSR